MPKMEYRAQNRAGSVSMYPDSGLLAGAVKPPVASALTAKCVAVIRSHPYLRPQATPTPIQNTNKMLIRRFLSVNNDVNASNVLAAKRSGSRRELM
mmetsp:Transcript_9291/g.15301  ORF Transcript_9291/g.15301 Transcript_9291/m.15301 type:complete len:96 (-) Transcript_9291:901-1188(-)